MKRLRVGIIYGGRSGEHEVSLASAASVFANLDKARYEGVPIRIERDGRWTLPDRPPAMLSAADVIGQARADGARAIRATREVQLLARPGGDTLLRFDRTGNDPQAHLDRTPVTGLALDVIFPVLHGPYGEDGTVQGLLELAGVPYVGAGVLASAVGMDKAAMKLVFAAAGLATPEHVVVRRREWLDDGDRVVATVTSRLPFPVFVKPANLGSSVGISKAKDLDALRTAIAMAADFDRKVIVEAAVPSAREIECAVLGNDTPEASVPGEIIPSREFYDYEAKYLDAGSQLLIPAPLTPDQRDEVQRLSIAAYRALDCEGMARVDFLLSRETGAVFVSEVNTIPGFTTISMYAKLWEASGVSYPQLIDRLIALALERHSEKQQLRVSMD